MITVADVVDLDRYPLDRPGDCADVVAAAREALAADGVALLEGFIRPSALEPLLAECEALERLGHHSVTLGTPYLGLPEDDREEGHPRRTQVRSSLAAVAYDRFPAGSILRSVYEWPPTAEFVRRVLDVDALFPYADPLGALNLAVMTAGDELGWHFDQTDFVVSIAIQAAAEGGHFEAATRVRTAGDECYPAVRAVLEGRATVGTGEVVHHEMRPGTLMLFEGRHSLHRVTSISGDRRRYVALLAYDTRPDTDSTDLLKLVRYGRLP